MRSITGLYHSAKMKNLKQMTSGEKSKIKLKRINLSFPVRKNQITLRKITDAKICKTKKSLFLDQITYCAHMTSLLLMMKVE